MNFIFYGLSGVLGGILGGMGMGGGTALIPLLVLFLGVEQKVAQATNVISFVPMAVITLIIHFKNKLVSKKGIFLMILPALISCVFGVLVAKSVKTEILVKFFGAFLIVLSITQIVCIIKKKTKIICATSINIKKNKNNAKNEEYLEK